MVICSSELRHHVALSPREEDRLVQQVKALRKSPLLAPLRGARTRRSLQARIASPCWDGRLRAGPEHRWGSLCGGGPGWRREEKDSDSYF